MRISIPPYWKRVFHRRLSTLGYRLIPFETQVAVPELKYRPINVFDLVVNDLVAKRPNLYFVQIGAHDGLQFDPIRPYVIRHHWHGLLVEPQSKIYAQLLKNYEDEPQLAFENAAVAPEDGTATLYTFAEDVNLPDHTTMLASFSRGALEQNGHGYVGKIEEASVAALSVSSLLAKHKVTHVDLLQIDAEGYDAEIIRLWNFERYKPLCIHFESATTAQEKRDECFKLLSELGYSLLTVGIDTIAYLQEAESEFVSALKMSKII